MVYGFASIDDVLESNEQSTNMDQDEDEETATKQQRVVPSEMRNEGQSHCINGAYRESVLCCTETIDAHTNEEFNINMINNRQKNDETLEAL